MPVPIGPPQGPRAFIEAPAVLPVAARRAWAAMAPCSRSCIQNRGDLGENLREGHIDARVAAVADNDICPSAGAERRWLAVASSHSSPSASLVCPAPRPPFARIGLGDRSPGQSMSSERSGSLANSSRIAGVPSRARSNKLIHHAPSNPLSRRDTHSPRTPRRRPIRSDTHARRNPPAYPATPARDRLSFRFA